MTCARLGCLHFCDALVELDPAPSHLAAQIAPVLGAVANDHAGGAIYGAVRRLAAVSEEKAARLVKAFLQDPNRRSVDLTPNALLGLSDSNPARAHKTALALSESKDRHAIRAARILDQFTGDVALRDKY